jgi:hypothetical protein
VVSNTVTTTNAIAITANITTLNVASFMTGPLLNISTSTSTTSVGFNAIASGQNSSAFGQSAQATEDSSTAIGAGAAATSNSSAFGCDSSASYEYSTALGYGATALAANVVVFPLFSNVGINTGLPTSTLHVVGNAYVSNALTTSELICNAFTTSTENTLTLVTEPPPARSTSAGWGGIRQVFGDYTTNSIYVYNNAGLETTLINSDASGFAMFVAIGGYNDNIIVSSGVDAYYVYYFYESTWQGPVVTDTTPDLGTTGTLWMPSLSAEGSPGLVIGGYGQASAVGGGNTKVGVYTIDPATGGRGSVGKITPSIGGGGNRNTVAISGDGMTIAIGQMETAILYIYSRTDLENPVFSSGRTDGGQEYYVSIDYYGHIVLLTIQGENSGTVLMYSNSLNSV